MGVQGVELFGFHLNGHYPLAAHGNAVTTWDIDWGYGGQPRPPLVVTAPEPIQRPVHLLMIVNGRNPTPDIAGKQKFEFLGRHYMRSQKRLVIAHCRRECRFHEAKVGP